VLSEPFVFQDGRAQSTANEYLDWSVIPNWYQKCVMQLNDNTKELAYNRRIVLGSSVVEVRGLVDFITDFSGVDAEATGNPEPAHAMFFDVQYQEPNLAIDDRERGNAGGKAFSGVIQPSFAANMGVNGTQKITVTSLRNNEAPDTENHPVTYLFSSSNSSVATVDASGNVTSHSAGTATITITLLQNTSITAKAEITVSAEEQAAEIVFTPELPAKMKQMQTYAGTVSIMRGGAQIEDAITMAVFGAAQAADAVFDSSTGELTINAYEPADAPLSLVFKASESGAAYTANIQLEGF
jgi:hypothetical protein